MTSTIRTHMNVVCFASVGFSRRGPEFACMRPASERFFVSCTAKHPPPEP